VITEIQKTVPKGEQGRVRYETDGHVAYFIWDGSNELNAATTDMYREFYDHLLAFRDDKDLWVGVLTGAGERAFSVGGDLKEMQRVSEAFTPEIASEHFWYPRSREPFTSSQVAEDIFYLKLYKPLIAAINGLCLGGGLVYVLGLTDLRIASEDAELGFSEVKRGLGGGGGLSGIARQIPYAQAMWLCLTGETITAEEACRIGIVNEVVPKEKVVERASEIAHMLCENSPGVVKLEKELILRSMDLDRDEALRFSWLMHYAQRYSHDAKAGLAAFGNGKKPEYRGW
jgi:enoyl-CoA hydratase/carnithine racemase